MLGDQEISVWAKRLESQLTADAERTVASLALVLRSRPRRRVRPRAGVWVLVGLLLGVLAQGFGSREPRSLRPSLAPLASLKDTPVQPEPACFEAVGGDRYRVRAACPWRLAKPGMNLVAMQDSWVHIEGDRRITMLEGWLVFDVDRVHDGPPVEVGISGGTVEVLGTRFSIYQDETRGHLELVEGKVRLVRPTGEPTLLTPGQNTSWQGEKRDPSSPTSSPPRAVRGETASTAIRGIMKLRSEGRHLEALELARRVIRTSSVRRTREVVHYEAGTILEGPLQDTARACRHWAEHLATFSGGRYTSQVADRMERLGCTG